MTDRISIITGTPAATAFPKLAAFLAAQTTLAPEVAEQALRAAAGDYVAAEEKLDVAAGWMVAVAKANGTIGAVSDLAPTAGAEKTAHPTWGAAVAAANPGVDSVKIVDPYRAPPPPEEIRVTAH